MSDDLEAIFAAMDSHYADFEDNVGDIIQNGGIVCHAGTVQRCPLDTGRLRSSYQYVKVGKLACSVGTNTKYGPDAELGHATRLGKGRKRSKYSKGIAYVPAKPHLYPGFRDGVNAIIDDLKDLGV